MVLYLASGSPRRAELLQQIAAPFSVLKALLLSDRNLATGSQSEFSASIKGCVQLVTYLGGHGNVFGAERACIAKTTVLGELHSLGWGAGGGPAVGVQNRYGRDSAARLLGSRSPGDRRAAAGLNLEFFCRDYEALIFCRVLGKV